MRALFIFAVVLFACGGRIEQSDKLKTYLHPDCVIPALDPTSCVHGNGDGSWLRCNADDGTYWVWSPEGTVWHLTPSGEVPLCEILADGTVVQ